MYRQLDRFRYLVRSIGLWGALHRTFLRFLEPIYLVDRGEIANHYIDHGSRPRELERGPDSVRGIAVDNVEELDAIRERLHSYFDYGELREYLAGGPGRFLVLAEYETADESVAYVGCRRLEQGFFRLRAGMLEGDIAQNIVMIHGNDVAPQFRGRGVMQRSRTGMYNHMETMGADRTTSIIRPHNIVSLHAHLKQPEGAVSSLNGEVFAERWLGGFWVRCTSWEEAKRLIEGPPGRTELMSTERRQLERVRKTGSRSSKS